MEKILLTILQISFLGVTAIGQEKVDANTNSLRLNRLVEEQVDYLVYHTDSSQQKRTSGDIWRRKTSFKKIGGKDVVVFNWDSFNNGKLFKSTTNICDRKTLAPIHHKTVMHAIGNEQIDSYAGVYAYDYRENKQIPSDSIADNKGKLIGEKQLNIPILNWEQDLETFALLPISNVGQQFEIAFFDPNEKEAKYHTYSITGIEQLKIGKDIEVNCWVLENRNLQSGYWVKFYLTQESGQVLKMIEHARGQYRIKVLQF